MKNFITLLLTIFVAFNMQAQSICNLIPNGDFEQGDTGFTSDYISVPDGLSVPLGSYWLTDYNNLQCIEIKDHSFCESGSANTNVMLVNGKFGQSTNVDNIIWETDQPITVTVNETYAFGFAFKKFADLFYSCGGDWISLRVEKSFDQGANWTTAAILPNLTTGSGECDWQEEQRNIFTSGSSLSIRILLEETEGRSGNAFALDDIFLREFQASSLQMSLESSIPANGSTPLDITASMGGSILPFDDNYYLPSACGYTWYVYNLDNGTYSNGGTVSGGFPWGTTTDFAGVDLFGNVNYRIIIYVSCPAGCFNTGWIMQDFRIDVPAFTTAKLGSNNTVGFTSTKTLEGRELEKFKELITSQSANQKDGDVVIIYPVVEEDNSGNRTTANEEIVTIWPNPFKNNVNIKFDKKPLGVNIMDMKGATIYDNRNINNLQLENIDISKAPAGIYIVKIEFEDGVVTKKIVKDNKQEIRN